MIWKNNNWLNLTYHNGCDCTTSSRCYSSITRWFWDLYINSNFLDAFWCHCGFVVKALFLQFYVWSVRGFTVCLKVRSTNVRFQHIKFIDFVNEYTYTYVVREMSDCIADAHLQVERKEFTFVATTNALHPRRDDRLITTAIHIYNQKEQTILGNANGLTKTFTFERIMHEKFIVRTKQTILETNSERKDSYKF